MEKVRFDELPIGIQKEALRAKRKPLLEAFDKYKSNVAYLPIEETESRHNAVVNWYEQVLDLDEYAINNPPDEIIRYVK